MPRGKGKGARISAGIDASNIIEVADDENSNDTPPSTSRHATRQRTNGRTDAIYDMRFHPADAVLRPTQAAKRGHGTAHLTSSDEDDDEAILELGSSSGSDLEDGEPSKGTNMRSGEPPRKKWKKERTPVRTSARMRGKSDAINYSTARHPQDSQLRLAGALPFRGRPGLTTTNEERADIEEPLPATQKKQGRPQNSVEVVIPAPISSRFAAQRSASHRSASTRSVSTKSTSKKDQSELRLAEGWSVFDVPPREKYFDHLNDSLYTGGSGPVAYSSTVLVRQKSGQDARVQQKILKERSEPVDVPSSSNSGNSDEHSHGADIIPNSDPLENDLDFADFLHDDVEPPDYLDVSSPLQNRSRHERYPPAVDHEESDSNGEESIPQLVPDDNEPSSDIPSDGYGPAIEETQAPTLMGRMEMSQTNDIEESLAGLDDSEGQVHERTDIPEIEETRMEDTRYAQALTAVKERLENNIKSHRRILIEETQAFYTAISSSPSVGQPKKQQYAEFDIYEDNGVGAAHQHPLSIEPYTDDKETRTLVDQDSTANATTDELSEDEEDDSNEEDDSSEDQENYIQGGRTFKPETQQVNRLLNFAASAHDTQSQLLMAAGRNLPFNEASTQAMGPRDISDLVEPLDTSIFATGISSPPRSAGGPQQPVFRPSSRPALTELPIDPRDYIEPGRQAMGPPQRPTPRLSPIRPFLETHSNGSSPDRPHTRSTAGSPLRFQLIR